MDNLILKFRVKHQDISRMDAIKPASGSMNYLKAKFSFSNEWNGLTKTACFTVDDDVYNVILENDECLIPYEATEESGFFDVSVFGGSLITVNTIRVYVTESGYAEGAAPATPTPSVYNQIITKLNALEKENIKDTVDAYLETVGAVTEDNVEDVVEGIIEELDVAYLDDTETSNTKTWSSGKVYNEMNSLKSELVTLDYPEYAKTEMESVATKVRGYIDTLDNPIVIGFNTDQHVTSYNSTDSQKRSTAEIKYGLNTLRDLTKMLPFNVVVLGGDTNGYQKSVSAMQKNTAFCIEQLSGADCPYVCLVGNHEGGQDDTTITLSQVFKSHITPSVSNKVVKATDKATNGYFDDVTCDVRFIFVNGYDRSGIYTVDEMKTQLSNALSTMPSGYNAIIFSHFPLDSNLPYSADKTQFNGARSCQDILIPYKDNIIACICGHSHNNATTMCDGIRFITTTTAGRVELNDGSTRPYNSADATAYDVFVVDTESKMIHCIRYGCGEDRDVSYENTTPPTPSGRQDILNGVNWTDGYRLNSSGALAELSGYSTTDAIEIESGDVLYFEDGTLPLNTSATQIYNDDGTVGDTISGYSTSDYGCTYASNYMYVSLRDSDDANISAQNWKYILATGKQSTTNVFGLMFGEFEFYDSGCIKSAKVDYTSKYNTIGGIRFTFPTAKKSVAHINVNKSFD